MVLQNAAPSRGNVKMEPLKHFGIEKPSETIPVEKGEPLDEVTRVQMESALGYSLKDVRVHITEQAGELSRRLQAEAFTIGTEVFGPPDNLRTTTSHARGLLAHELTHVIQQTHPPLAFSPSSGIYGTQIPTSHNNMSQMAELQLAPLNTSGRGSSESAAMEASAEAAELAARHSGEEKDTPRTSPVNADEIAQYVYRLMQQDLLLENERRR
jgi:hypothetical protein